jgi:hypothetical protein
VVNLTSGTSLAAPAGKGHGHSVPFNLAAIALVVAVAGLGLAYVIDALGRATHERPGIESGTLTRSLGGKSLAIPAAWFTGDPAQSAGFAKQIDLSVNLPLGPGGTVRRIDVTLTQPSRVRPSASLLDGVYLHQFLPDQLSGPPGLVGKPMAPSEGYESETVWYDPIGQSPFVAKCEAPVAKGVAGTCLRTVLLGPGISAVYSFPDDVLANWKMFDAELHPLLSQIGAL